MVPERPPLMMIMLGLGMGTNPDLASSFRDQLISNSILVRVLIIASAVLESKVRRRPHREGPELARTFDNVNTEYHLSFLKTPKRYLMQDFAKDVWMRLRIRESLVGILLGSIFGAFATLVFIWLARLWVALGKSTLSSLVTYRAPIATAMIVLLALIIPRFFRKSLCLFRSWRAGLIRGVSLVGALSVFDYWLQRSYLLFFVIAPVLFQILNAIADRRRKPQQYSAKEIAGWVPRRDRSSVADVGFDKPIEHSPDT